MTDEIEVVQRLLNKWTVKYCPENIGKMEEYPLIMFVSYHTHKVHNYEGWTKYVRFPNSGKRCADIYMKPIYKNRPTLRKIVLWHEFCHAWGWCSFGDGENEHGLEFFKKIIQKPHLFLGQVGLAFVVPFLKG